MDGVTQPALALASGLQVCALPVLWLDAGARPGMQTSVCVCAPCFFLGHAGRQGVQCSLIRPLVWATRGKGLRGELVDVYQFLFVVSFSETGCISVYNVFSTCPLKLN